MIQPEDNEHDDSWKPNYRALLGCAAAMYLSALALIGILWGLKQLVTG